MKINTDSQNHSQKKNPTNIYQMDTLKKTMQTTPNTDFVLKIIDAIKTLWKMTELIDKKGALQLELELESESSNS